METINRGQQIKNTIRTQLFVQHKLRSSSTHGAYFINTKVEKEKKNINQSEIKNHPL